MDSRFYRLADGYVLRGWDRLPYAYINTATNAPTFLHADIASALILCDGEHDIDSPFVSSAQRADVARFEERGVVVPCREGEGLSDRQRYRCYPNRFFSDVQWSVTGRCNFSCKHCMMSAPEAALGELSQISALDIVDQIAECGILRVSLTGGELFVRRDMSELVEALVSKGIVISQIYTNGALLDESFLDMFAGLRQKPEVVISFDGVGCHDWLRGVRGAEAMADRAIELCCNRGITTKVQMMVHRDNISSLRTTVRHLGELGCSSLRVGRVKDVGDWVANGQELTLSVEELFEAELAYLPHYFEDGMPLPLTLAGLVQLSPEEPDRYAVSPYKGGGEECDGQLLSCARRSISISADGIPSICELARPLRDSSLVALTPIASDDPKVHTVRLREVLSGGSEFVESLYLRESDLAAAGQDCAECRYLNACKGGCRASAFCETGSILGPDPEACTFFKGGWAEKVISTMREVRPSASSKILEDPLFACA